MARAASTLQPAAELAALRAADPDGWQAAYDAARDLQEALRAAGPVSARCRPLQVALARYAAGRVRQMEGIDRPSAGDVAAGRRAAEAARAPVRAGAARGLCRGPGGRAAAAPAAMSPSDGEAFLGVVVARAPAGADAARLTVDGRPAGEVAVRGGRARFTVSASPGRHALRVDFTRAGAPAGSSRAAGAWLLPRSAAAAVPGDRVDPARAAALTRALSGAPAYRAAWVQDLATGATAGVAAGAPFPAASTVKIGLLVGALARLGAAPERAPLAYDLRAMAGWSSNLATNRVLRRLGGAATAADGLRRLGARSSTFPGEYIVGTELQPALPAPGAGAAPPRVSRRVTTAQDLGRMLFALHAAAVGAPGARAQTGLTAHAARLGIGWLLGSEQRGDNASLLAAGLPAGTPVAQKNGWVRAARHGAGIAYTPRGPVIAVLLTYDDRGVSLPRARAVGARVAGVAAGP
ncbi:serine hydrolase [Miltoncostaea oceani]|uniref:serine hydrolase n=1 Tax=Miltoncostaea oceani TaxID=2843216 RepID=UPI001C3DFA0E|nr:serine hydrolase [Miltoncostaea oceani]